MADKPHYHGHRERLRRRLERDPGQLADYELLELLLGLVHKRADTKPLAKSLLERFGHLDDVMAARPSQLHKVKGFGPACGNLWRLLREISARAAEAPVTRGRVLDSPETVAEFGKARLGLLEGEEFWVALVDNANRLLAWEPVCRGTVDQAAVYTRDVLAKALEYKATGVILVHNHPSGDPTPSRSDVDLTGRLVAAARDLGVRILDHLVVTRSAYYSFQAHGRL